MIFFLCEQRMKLLYNGKHPNYPSIAQRGRGGRKEERKRKGEILNEPEPGERGHVQCVMLVGFICGFELNITPSPYTLLCKSVKVQT